MQQPLPLTPPKPHEDAKNRKRMVALYGEYDGVNVLPQLLGQSVPQRRNLFWRLQGQTAVLSGDEKLIRLSHRPAQLFRPSSDAGEQDDLMDRESTRASELFQQLGEWESMLPTVPLWGSSPYWTGESASQYDSYDVRDEPYE